MGDSKSRSRSKSKSSDKRAEKKKHKKDKKHKSHKSHRASRDSRSRSKSISSNSHSRSKSSSESRHKNKDRVYEKRFDRVPKNITKPKERIDDKGKKRPSVNNFALAGFLLETKRTNERIDKDEVNRANQQFKKIDKSERQSVLLSAALNQNDQWRDRDEYYMEYRNGEYIKVLKPFICAHEGCGMRFILSTDLDKHLKSHQEKVQHENEINKQRAEDFLKAFNL